MGDESVEVSDELLTALSTVVNNLEFARCPKGIPYAKAAIFGDFCIIPDLHYDCLEN
jgi:hypothetical protein